MKKIIYALLLTLWALLPPVLTGVVTSVGGMRAEATIYLIQGLITAATVLVLLLVSRKRGYAWFGLKLPDVKPALWLIPAVLIEVLPFIGGIGWKGSVPAAMSLVFCMICVGVAEELIFRGFILRRFRQSGIRPAILVSGIFFSLGHAANLLGGQDFAATLHQLLFALLFGLVAAELAVLSGSITVGVCWHIVHNLIATLTGSTTESIETVVLILQLILLAGMAVILWRRLANNRQGTRREQAGVKTQR